MGKYKLPNKIIVIPNKTKNFTKYLIIFFGHIAHPIRIIALACGPPSSGKTLFFKIHR